MRIEFDPWGDEAAPGVAPLPEAETTDYRSLPFVPALRACIACPCRQTATGVVLGMGPRASSVLVLGQHPGAEDDRHGEPFAGPGGAELTAWLTALGIARDRALLTYAVKCCPGDRIPKTSELKTCTNLWLAQEFDALPAVRVVLTVGKPAVQALLGKSAPPMTPLLAHHIRIRVAQRERHVFPLPHPAFLLRARHLAPLFRTVLTHLRLTLHQELPDVMDAVRPR